MTKVGTFPPALHRSAQPALPPAGAFGHRVGTSAPRPGHHPMLAPTWHGHAIQLPPVRALPTGEASFSSDDLRRTSGVAIERPAVGAWEIPTLPELQQALSFEPVLQAAFADEGQHETSRWLGSVQGALATATSGPGARGAELVLRFPACYGNGNVAHLALGTVFRDPGGTLQARFLHQESLPDVDADGARPGTFTGRVYASFETSGDHPDGLSPVAESVRLVGLPYVNVFPCARPQELQQITEALQRGVGDHVYAPSVTWPGVAAGRDAGKPLYGTCFTITQIAHEALAGRPLVFPADHDSARSFEALARLACIDLANYRTVSVGRSAVPLSEAFADTQPVRKQMVAFLTLGTAWGQDGPWDAQPARSADARSVSVGAGPLRFTGEQLARGWHSIKFNRVPIGVTLDGEPVRAGVTYSREECDRMQVAAALELRFNVSFPTAR